jgi:N-formylmaleamate deformylase
VTTTWKECFVGVKGDRFHIVGSSVPEQSKRRPLVVLHGHTDNAWCFTPIAQHWAQDYDIILPDSRGHGQSPRVAPDQNIDNVADLATILRALGVNKFALGGHSMGANTAAAFAARHPALVSALVLEDPAWRLVEPDRRPGTPWYMKSMRYKDMSVDERVATEKKAHPQWSDEEYKVWGPAKGQYDYNYLTAFRGWTGWQEDAARIQCPGLLLTGDPPRDSLVTPEVAAMVSRAWSKVQVVHIAGAGHAIHREQPAAYLEAVDAFLAREYPAS